jgi:hypothetical protein
VDKVKKIILSFNFSYALFSVPSETGDAGFGLVQGDQCGLEWSVLALIQEYKTSSHLSTTLKKKTSSCIRVNMVLQF